MEFDGNPQKAWRTCAHIFQKAFESNYNHELYDYMYLYTPNCMLSCTSPQAFSVIMGV